MSPVPSPAALGLPQPRPPVPATPEQRAAWPAVLVSMPFMMIDRPSIQLGLLKAIGTRHGFDVRTLHANLDLAARLGPERYSVLCERRGRMVGDWLFAAEAFGAATPDPDGRLLDDFPDELSYLIGEAGEHRQELLDLRRHEIPSYLDALVESFPWQDVRVVGFTCTFQQNAASFALARRLKQRHPQLVTVFGGANFDAEMGIEHVRAIDCIDYAVIGEGDTALPGLLTALATGADPARVPGVARRAGAAVEAADPAPPLSRLDDLPPPDYDEYFAHAEELGLQPRAAHRTVRIPFESARGCWWGAKHHCTFCGLNGTGMQFRAKSAPRVAAELGELARRYRSFRFDAVDNILDMGQLSALFPELIATGTTYDLFYEVKANLTREHLRLLSQAGVTHLQPGIESLSSHVLSLMRKGVRAAQNVNVLRWGQYHGIAVSWNVLWGFAGETKDDYAAQAEVMPHLVHLRPPTGAGRVWLERFSPMYTDPAVGVRRRAPERSYGYVYPGHVDLDKVAYFFEYELADALPDSAYAGVRRAVEQWQAAWERETRPTLTYFCAPGLLQLYDARHPGKEGTYTFEGDLADIYLACSDRPIAASAVRDRLDGRLPVTVIEEAFDAFAERGLMFLDGRQALSLALPAGPAR